jgi:hypothetical protein
MSHNIRITGNDKTDIDGLPMIKLIFIYFELKSGGEVLRKKFRGVHTGDRPEDF